MPNTTDFLPIAIGSGSLVTDQATWAGESNRETGFQNGIVLPQDFNKALRQCSMPAAMIATFTAAYGASNVPDDGDLPGFLTRFSSALATFIKQTSSVGAISQRGLSADGNGNLGLNFDNLASVSAFNNADKIALYAEEAENGSQAGTPFATTLGGLGSFFSSFFQQNTTFTQITSTNSVGLSINGGDVTIPQGVTTVVPLQSITVNSSFGSVGNGVLTVMKAGYYIFIASGALFLNSSHAQDSATLRFNLNLSRNGTGYGGAPCGGLFPVPNGGGQAAANLLLPQIQYLAAGDQISLLAYAANQYGDASTVGISGYTNMLVALLNS